MSAMSNVAKLVCAYFSLGSPYVLRQALKCSQDGHKLTLWTKVTLKS